MHGVTLVELLVALAASAIVLVFVVAAVKAQQDAYQGGQRVREAQGAARNALLFIEQKLATAGYGIDPALAFDLSGMPGDPDPAWYVGPCPAPATPCVKDRIDGSDELVFFSRNPSYWAPRPEDALPPGSTRGRSWDLAEAFDPSTNRIRLLAHKGDVFLQGQILQGVCDQGQGQRFFTVRRTVGPLADDASQYVDLVVEGDLKNPFIRQSAGQCTPTRVFQIDRYRFHVRPIGVAGSTYESYLVLDSGVDVSGPAGVPDGTIDELDETILAPGVEVMQVAYHFTFHSDPPPAPLAVVGATPGTLLKVQPGAPNDAVQADRGVALSLVSGGVPTAAGVAADTITRPDFTSPALQDAKFYTQASLFDYRFGPPITPERKTNYLANVRAVQVVLVTRSATPAPEGAASFVPGPSAPVLNLNQTPAWIAGASTTAAGGDRYARIRLDTTVTLSNMVARRLLYD